MTDPIHPASGDLEAAYWEDVAARYDKVLRRIVSGDVDFLGEAQDMASEALSATQPFRPDHIGEATTMMPANPSCQACAGRIEGWTCQSCEQTFTELDGKLIMDRPANPDHVPDASNMIPPTPPATAAGVGEAELIRSLAERGYKTPGCDNWRAVEMCRQIMQLATTPASHDALIARVRSGLQKIADGQEVRLEDGTTVMVEIDDPEAIARALLIDLDARDGG